MARPLRINVAGGWYHITARGQNRQVIYLDDRDRNHFLELVAELGQLHGVEIHAYVLMPNHYHLIMRTPMANASAAIQWLNVSYAIWWNRRHGRIGHLFQGRFKAVLVEGGQWLQELSLYVHGNPVAVAGLGLGKAEKAVEQQGLREPSQEVIAARLETLRGYRWSSYRAYAGYEKAPVWLWTDEVLGRSGGSKEKYRDWVEGRWGKTEAESPWQRLKWGLVLGGEQFADAARQQLKPSRETLGRRLLRARMSWEQIVAHVENLRGESWTTMRDRHGDTGRELAWWAGRTYAGLTLRELGERAGGVDYTAVAMALRRFNAKVQRNRKLAAAQQSLAAKCEM